MAKHLNQVDAVIPRISTEPLTTAAPWFRQFESLAYLLVNHSQPSDLTGQNCIPLHVSLTAAMAYRSPPQGFADSPGRKRRAIDMPMEKSVARLIP